MSEASPNPEASKAEPASLPKSHWGRRILWTAGALLAFLLLLVGGASWYTTTDDFQRRVRGEVVRVLEDSTGGRVELGHISFSLWHLAIEADGLVIHGTEAPGEMPYLSAEKILVRVRIHTFLSHSVGRGPQSHIGLNFLRVEKPHVHLIVDKDGNTNQPVPKRPSPSTEPIQDTLLDLQAGEVEFADGLAVLNDRAMPFDLAANNLNAQVAYLSSSDRYGITVDLADLRTKMGTYPEVQSKLHLTGQLGRDMAELKSFEFDTEGNSQFKATGLIEHFNKPEWQADINGEIALKQLGYLAGIDGFRAGTVSLDVHGRNCVVTPQAAQKNPHFWQRHNKKPLPPDIKLLPPDPDCKAGYLLVGTVKANRAGYSIPNARLHDVNASAQLHVTPTELLFTALTTQLPGGGTILGELKIENWLGEVPPSDTTSSPAAKSPAKPAAAVAALSQGPQPVDRAHAYMTVTVKGIGLRTIMEITAVPGYGDLGYDTSIAGPVKVEWGGAVSDIEHSVQVDANLKFSPQGDTRGKISNVPLTGEVQGHYDGRTEVVKIANLSLHSPASSLTASGVLGVNEGDPLTNLQTNLQVRDLGEFDQVLQTLGLQANGKKGRAAIPVLLHGSLGFTGLAKGEVRNLDVKGHLEADNLALQLGSLADIHLDSVVGDAEYSPNGGVAIASSTIKRGTAVLNVTGDFKPRRVVSKRGAASFVWDDQLGIDATVKLASAQATDLLQIAGQQQKVPVTGTVDLNGHVAGTVQDLTGGGSITLKNGVAYGENYQTVSVDAAIQGQQINATKILVQAHDMSVTGHAAYNLTSKGIQAQLAGNNIVLSKLDTMAKKAPGDDGVVTFSVDANGTKEEPNLHAKLHVAKMVVEGKALGDLNATASSTGSNVSYDVNSTLMGAQFGLTGQTSLLGNYQTDAKLTVADFDIANALAMFAPESVKGSSRIGGVITVSGPAAKPEELTGNAEFNDVDLKLEGVELKTVGPLKASLRGGIATLDQMHITGDNTDLSVGGTAQVFGDANPNGGRLNLNTKGSISMALAHTFDPDLITSGKVTFQVAAEGRLKKPSLTGNVNFENVAIAVDGIPNGLSNLNGSLVFNENRLDVKQLTATTGGGQMKIGGSLIYQKGLFADLTATGESVRVRLYGLSATATSSFRLQGSSNSLLLSGNVLITRFGVGPDVDFAAFAGSGGVQAPPDPNSATNKIRLDVHIASSPQLDFQNSYAKLAGTVDLTVRGTLAVPNVLGRIQITDGSATFAGTKYQLERGSIYFSNPVRIDPVIDLDASARVENYDIAIGLHGTMTNMKPTYRSEPPLTEADIFNLLALGRTQEEAQLYQEQQVQAGTDPTTSALLGGALNATVSSRVSKLFGAGSVKIDPSFVGTLGNSAARITVQEPISKQVTLTFATNVNQTAEQLIQVQYQINENTALVATRDESGVFSIVYKIRKRYR